MLDKRYLTLSIVAKTKSYTATANQLYMTQPAVSQQISSLENEVGMKLVEYKHQKLSVTTAGAKLVEFVDKTQTEANKLMAQVQNDTSHTTLRIGSTRSLGIFLLPELIRKIDRDNQSIKTVIGNTSDILQALRDGTVDFGLIEGNFDKDEFDAIRIRNEPFVGVTSIHNGRSSQQAMSIDDLLNQSLLIRETGSGTREIFSSWLATQNYKLTDFNHQIEIASPATIIRLLEDGVGISFMYQSLILDKLAEFKLTTIKLNNFNIDHPINLVYLKDSYFHQEYQNIAAKIIDN